MLLIFFRSTRNDLSIICFVDKFIDVAADRILLFIITIFKNYRESSNFNNILLGIDVTSNRIISKNTMTIERVEKIHDPTARESCINSERRQINYSFHSCLFFDFQYPTSRLY